MVDPDTDVQEAKASRQPGWGPEIAVWCGTIEKTIQNCAGIVHETRNKVRHGLILRNLSKH
ncbi:hypothetical protein N7535_008850 [Penicillium sp. DV-2018c]|nr:hypothetical protein N7461_002605 [Penicillium sp. DV-2018c]KAJ5563686.1 hypothetical protein N7535_008850 [Penicillium sp. DV-2018c]